MQQFDAERDLAVLLQDLLATDLEGLELEEQVTVINELKRLKMGLEVLKDRVLFLPDAYEEQKTVILRYVEAITQKLLPFQRAVKSARK